MIFCRSTRRRAPDRRGAILVLVAVMSTALVSVGALVINWSYVELTNTQLRSASDAAAKAAAVALSQEQNQGRARAVARQVAREYYIGGQQLRLRNADIQFGHGASDGEGGYTFIQGEQPLNCARVVARCGGGAATASVPVLFANLLPEDNFALEKESIAGRYDHDIVFVVDRSGSMAWDLTGNVFSYPSEFNNDSTLQNYFREPYMGYDLSQADPNLRQSRWGAMVRALGVFNDALDDRNLNPQTSLVSFASDYTFGLFSSTRVSRDQTLDKNTQLAVDAAYSLANSPLIGDTTIAAGIYNGRSLLTSSSERRMTANRTMILLTDGSFGDGLRGNALRAADRCAGNRITIHTVGFGADGDGDALLTQIAEATGGRYYDVDLGEEEDASFEALLAAFRDIAEQLPAVLIR